MIKEKLGSVQLKEKGQITIPAKARKALQIKTGDRLDLYLNEKQELILVKNGKRKQIGELALEGTDRI
ncbi:MAG: AbrB/MazE/SpoVT family DNA-binding domain-containing protein [Erysipelotrichaceae bacterium]|nr:AbrB/MazE/SpoVT family DNA-binding domain-containing protein [Erysipelotrichaceae bacterium]MBQ1787464.1 AbrB/MazE/SpoVT family DNA-binding domain-containing protein [Erysipelotrichaceae bacterium]MBQ5804641.1 AbrB/MazE/SpoVT family DNA-binding domain-containing protein [Erysipelotrichaceae bacterium]